MRKNPKNNSGRRRAGRVMGSCLAGREEDGGEVRVASCGVGAAAQNGLVVRGPRRAEGAVPRSSGRVRRRAGRVMDSRGGGKMAERSE